MKLFSKLTLIHNFLIFREQVEISVEKNPLRIKNLENFWKYRKKILEQKTHDALWYVIAPTKSEWSTALILLVARTVNLSPA